MEGSKVCTATTFSKKGKETGLLGGGRTWEKH